ncbi:hypothetical protein [Amycolatopsis plumensis]|uniref:Uncharacterized protein n=1 Tax=Amycolatopsis plumensis TaxID=236508 RepID=A0ABV5UIE4_9PSEU
MTAALTRGQQPHQLDDDHQRRRTHPLDALVPDPAGLPAVCDELEFAAILEEMVADEAPRLFGVVQEYGERVDGRIAAWGLAFDDHTEVVSAGRTRQMCLQAPENALRLFRVGSQIRARLVWFNLDAATPAGDDEAA